MNDAPGASAVPGGADPELLPSLYAAIEAANDAVIVFDCPGPGAPFVFRYVNRMFEQQTGYTREEALGQPQALLYGPETDLALMALWETELYAGHALKGEILKYRRNGTTFWAEVNMRPYERSGSKLRAIAIQRDVTLRRERETRLAQTQDMLASMVANANAAIYACDVAGRFLLVNARFATLTGTRVGDLTGRYMDDALGSAQAATLQRSIDRVRTHGMSIVDEERIADASGATRTLLSLTFPLRDESGDTFGFCGMATDITDRVEARARLELFSYAMDHATDGICIFELEGETWRITYANEMFERLIGYSAHEVIGHTSDMLMAEPLDHVRRNRIELARGGETRTRHQMRRKDGTVFWAQLNARGLADDDGRVTHSIVLYRDVTSDVLRERRLSYDATHDALTGIYNRRYFLDVLEAALGDARTRERARTLVYFDLDEFKPINDRYGHEAGDRLLAAIAGSVASRVRGCDVFARVGGDEFALLFSAGSDVTSVAGDILETIDQVCLAWEDAQLHVSASVGAVTLGACFADANAAMRAADSACYSAKRSGRNRVVIA